jgi:hypothetical protein
MFPQVTVSEISTTAMVTRQKKKQKQYQNNGRILNQFTNRLPVGWSDSAYPRRAEATG